MPGNVGFPNSNFEDWFTSIVDKPLYWTSFSYIGLDTLDPTANHMVSKVYFNAPFDFAAQIKNIAAPLVGIGGGELSTHNNIFNDYPDDFAVRGKHVTLNGYYKFFPAPGDTMQILVSMYKNDSVIGFGLLEVGDSVPDFSPFSIPINYTSTAIPDSGSLRLRSGKENPKLGTTLTVDKLSFDGFVSAVNNAKPDVLEMDGMKVYPNPARDLLVIENLSDKDCSLSLLNVSGQILREIKLPAGQHSTQMEVGDLAPGFYLLVMKKGDDHFTKKIIIQR